MKVSFIVSSLSNTTTRGCLNHHRHHAYASITAAVAASAIITRKLSSTTIANSMLLPLSSSSISSASSSPNKICSCCSSSSTSTMNHAKCTTSNSALHYSTYSRRSARRQPHFSQLHPPSPPPSAEEAVNNILYNTPPQGPSPVTRHILNCLVSNEPGVLSRVSGILAARGFNIDSLVVARTEVPDLSRMTVVLRGRDNTIEQARRQLEDLVPVWAVLDYTHTPIVERELLLVKVSGLPQEFVPSHAQSATAAAAAAASGPAYVEDEEAGDEVEFEGFQESEQRVTPTTLSPLLAAGIQRQAITELSRLFKANVVDVTFDNMVVELCASPARVDAFLKMLKPYGIIEATRSGSITLAKSPVEGVHASDQSAGDPAEAAPAVDATQLPPG